MKFKLCLLFAGILLSGLLQFVSAQDIQVTGTVTNKTNGEPLVGATISVKGSNKPAIYDIKGVFSLTAKKGAVLVISYAGMKPVDVTVADNSSALVIQMEESATATLSDVVVVGYGTQKIT